MEVSWNGGTPNGWFIVENLVENGWFGGTSILGTPQINKDKLQLGKTSMEENTDMDTYPESVWELQTSKVHKYETL